MAIQKEIWASDIVEKLFPENTFMTRGLNDDVWVDGKKVHLAQAGTLPTVVRDRATVPATITQRTDTDADYDLHEHTSDPTLVRDIEETEVNYQKRSSVLQGHIKQLNNDIANWLAYYWAASNASNIIRTSGANRASVIAGATGNRKKLAIQDLFKAKALMDDMDLPEQGRCMLLPAYMYNDLIENDMDKLLRIEYSGSARIDNGVIKKILGFDIYKRGKKNLLSYSNAATPVKREPGASALTSANAGTIFWHEDFVRRALGEVKVFANEDEAAYYGSIFSTLARSGGRAAYADETGIGVIVESAGA